MSAQSGELVATDEPTVITKPVFDTVVVEDGEDYGCLANSTSAIGMRCSTNPKIFSINPSRPKKILGERGSVSPGKLDANIRYWIPQ